MIGNVHLRTEVPGNETDEPRAAAQFENIQALEGFASSGDIARQNLQ